ncbi:MAG TPA: RNA methyltransferase [Bacteroidales bacterium]|nr:RNA methyltransferase [Bacteroidales bacterium]
MKTVRPVSKKELQNMLSKNKARFIMSLQKKKTREEEGLYIIEGDKIVREFLEAGIRVRILAAKPEFLRALPSSFAGLADETVEVSFEDLKQISSLKTPHNALAAVPIPGKQADTDIILSDLCCALEFVQDPGNLGTIIRAAGWFGIKNIICSADCVDVYNPKVIQASMGAILHVNVYYKDLREFLSGARSRKVPVFGMMLDGESVYESQLDSKGIILLGNESKGISGELIQYVTSKIKIPQFSISGPGIDSLNVSMAASIVFSEFRRR